MIATGGLQGLTGFAACLGFCGLIHICEYAIWFILHGTDLRASPMKKRRIDDRTYLGTWADAENWTQTWRAIQFFLLVSTMAMAAFSSYEVTKISSSHPVTGIIDAMLSSLNAVPFVHFPGSADEVNMCFPDQVLYGSRSSSAWSGSPFSMHL